MTDRRPVTIDDLTRIRWPLDPALSPNGRELAYVVSGPDAASDSLDYRLSVVSLDGIDSKVVRAGARARLPRWSPDGLALGFLAATDDTWQLAIDGRSTVPIGGGVAGFDWSPDGGRVVAFGPGGRPGAPRAPATELAVHDVEAARWLELDSHPFTEVGSVRWSPTGDIAVIGKTPSHPGALWILDPDDHGWSEVLAWNGPMNSIAWSPDGSTLAFTGHPHGSAGWINHELWLIDPGGADPIQLAPNLDRSIGQTVRGDDERGIAPVDIRWAGDRVIAAFADGGRGVVAAFGPDGTVDPIFEGDRSALDFDVAASGDIAISWSDSMTPGEVSVLTDDGETVVTDVSTSWTRQARLAPTTTLDHPRMDGGLAQGWLTEPLATDDPAPLVVQVHGGPHYPIGHRFSFDAQRLAAQGLAVLRCNPRGSQGYGADHAAGIHRDWGGADFDDVVALVERAAGRDGIDHDRIAIMGESYGGFMTNWALAHSDRFAAGVSENGISDLTSLGSGPNGPGFWHLEMEGSPTERPMEYRERSPITHAGSIHAPLLLVHAEEDRTCPIAQSEMLREAIASRGGDVTLIRIPGEEHFVNVYGRPSRRIEKTQRIDWFLLEHLGERVGAEQARRQPAKHPGGGQ